MLFLILTTDAIEQSVNSAVRTEARIAMLDALADDPSPAPPYLRAPLSMHVVDTYRDPGVVVEVRDAQGQVRYLYDEWHANPTEHRDDAHGARWPATRLVRYLS